MHFFQIIRVHCIAVYQPHCIIFTFENKVGIICLMYLYKPANERWTDTGLEKARKHHLILISISLSKNFSSHDVLRNSLHDRLQTDLLPRCSFTLLAESLFQVRRQLEKLDELLTRLTYDGDPIPVQRPQLLEKVNFLLYNLFRKCVSHCPRTSLYPNWHKSIGNNDTTLLGRKKKKDKSLSLWRS